MTRLDCRLLACDLPLAVLAQIFAEHFRGVPAAMSCDWCGHRFADNDTESDWPTNTVVRPLILRRWRENKAAVARLLSAIALESLLKGIPKPVRANTSAPIPETGDLFDVTPYRRIGGPL